jgi:MFS family permease
MARRLIISVHPNFGLFSCARCVATFAFQMQSVAVAWQIYALTHSTLAVGMVGLAQFLPMVLCTLPAGHLADHGDRRTIAVFMEGAQGLALAFLAIGSYGGWLRAPILFAVVAVIGAARTFERTAIQALIPSLVPPAELSEAVAWSSGIFEFSAVTGPALGGLICGWNPSLCYAIAAALVFAAIGFLSFISTGKGARSGPPATLASLFSGIHFIRRRPVILGSISLDLFAVLLGGATALLPVYAQDILHIGARGYGVLRAAPAIGSLAMTAWLVQHPIRRRAGRKMFAAVFAFGAATIVFGLSRSFALSFAALVTLGAADIVSVVIRGSLVQLRTPDDMRGRVGAVNGLFIGTSNQLGEFESGVTASWWGTVPATVLGGVGTLLVGLLWMRAFPELTACDQLEKAAPDS